MDETTPPARAAEDGPASADQDGAEPEPPACSPGALLPPAEAEPDSDDDGWVSL
jgi:hypothetical protein